MLLLNCSCHWFFKGLSALFFAGLFFISSVFFVQASPSHSSAHASVKLLGGGYQPHKNGAPYAIGLEIRLEKDWVTYWKTAGEGGYPARFDWSGSDNVANVVVHWPAPQYFNKGGHVFYGYKDYVILPVLVYPRDPDQNISLQLQMDYAVCNLQCVPLSAHFPTQKLIEQPSSFEAILVSGALKRLPRAISLAQVQSLYPLSVTLGERQGQPALLLDVSSASSLSIENIFLHDSGQHFSILKAEENQPTRFYARVLSPPSKEALRNSSITLHSHHGTLEVSELFP